MVAFAFHPWPRGCPAHVNEFHPGGRAWRGYFPLGGELTSGRPDRKEGIYFGTELGPQDIRVQAGLPLHGANLYPDLPQFRERVLTYLDAVTTLGQKLFAAIAAGTARISRRFREPTVTICWAGSPRYSRSLASGIFAGSDCEDEVGSI
jgi:isopenicillin N synthase-like dioxygenase